MGIMDRITDARAMVALMNDRDHEIQELTHVIDELVAPDPEEVIIKVGAHVCVAPPEVLADIAALLNAAKRDKEREADQDIGALYRFNLKT